VMEAKENTSFGDCSLIDRENLLKNDTDTWGLIHCGWYLKQILAAGWSHALNPEVYLFFPALSGSCISCKVYWLLLPFVAGICSHHECNLECTENILIRKVNYTNQCSEMLMNCILFVWHIIAIFWIKGKKILIDVCIIYIYIYIYISPKEEERINVSTADDWIWAFMM
jgi:hypothetical protein